ncbi:Uncharacterised protein [Staphylococcus gallinarum]|uniref:Uncharacterized protein n=1 Tax=Staphylococcus gallinarum TaxID=1293 RepID=A0A380FB85_STAGA|nr:Uncharacterised protein [Staphylococcus gallinarum]
MYHNKNLGVQKGYKVRVLSWKDLLTIEIV